MFDAVFTQTLSQQSSLQELIKNCMLEELQGLLSPFAGTRLLYLSGVKCPIPALPSFHGEVQNRSNQFLTFILKILLERDRGLLSQATLEHTGPRQLLPGGVWSPVGMQKGGWMSGRSLQGDALAVRDPLCRSASDQPSTPLNEEPSNCLLLL